MSNPQRLPRSLGLFDAIVLGLASMIGAGVFASVGPAAGAAGSGLLIGLVVAGAVAYANATSSAQLAARYPEAGGTYVYGTRVLGPFWGYLAGWVFVVGKSLSLSAMALTVGYYLYGPAGRAIGVGAVVAMAAVNYLGVTKTAGAARWILAAVLAVLAVLVATALTSSELDPGHLIGETTAMGVLQAAGFLFFAFAGYARIATLGEEVTEPERVIPRAIPLALGIALVVYGVVAVSALVAVGPQALAASEAPLATAAAAGGSWVVPVVRFGAALASLGVLLSLLAGVSRTVLAMARDRHLPTALTAVHPVHQTPHRAELVVMAVVVVVVAVVDIPQAIGISSFSVLTYYAIANLAALRQPDTERRWPKWLQMFGVAGCAALAFSLPAVSVVSGVVLAAAGCVIWVARRRLSASG